MLQAIILCAGTAERWKDHLDRPYLGVPKQLAKINGEPLLMRTLTQLHNHGINPISIMSHDKNLELPGTKLILPKDCQWTSATLASSEIIWKRSQLILLGDVYYTDAALKTIINSTAPLMFFGCPTANPHTGSVWPELYALKFTRTAIPDLKKALSTTLKDAAQGGRGKLWELLMALRGRSLQKIKETGNMGLATGSFFTTISDLTDDIDTPADYHRLCTVLRMSQERVLL